MMNASFPAVSRFFSAPDGLKLHLRDYGSSLDPGLPVVCLPGLARSAADFAPLATALAQGASGIRRRVIAIDYRGRGLSDRDADWRNYDLNIEHTDILAVLAATGIEKAIFIGTSRGGLHIMLLGATRPGLMQGAILNDVGPVLETDGLTRIRGYLGDFPSPASLAEAKALLKTVMSRQFSNLTEEEWEVFTRLTFEDETGRFGAKYDPMLMKPLEALDLATPLPTLWPQFEGLREVPLLVIRGGNSDLLSAATLAEMTKRHPNCETYVVDGQGHAPLLLDAASIERIAGFIAMAEAKA
jgi:pimeloyl-ACP methyl ester carboxylesterase